MTPPYPNAAGKTLFINALTLEGGEVSAELLGSDKRPLSGYRREDCVGFQGDAQHTPLAWRGNSPSPENGVTVRFYIRRARLYGFEWA
jgi:hypothetical protein